MSWDLNPDGAIRTIHIHTPITQTRLISSDDFLSIILSISGMLNSGKATAATKPIISIHDFSIMIILEVWIKEK